MPASPPVDGFRLEPGRDVASSPAETAPAPDERIGTPTTVLGHFIPLEAPRAFAAAIRDSLPR